MTKHEICDLYRHAKNKPREVGILAELTASDKETIEEVLRDADLYREADREKMIAMRRASVRRAAQTLNKRLTKAKLEEKKWRH